MRGGLRESASRLTPLHPYPLKLRGGRADSRPGLAVCSRLRERAARVEILLCGRWISSASLWLVPPTVR